MPPQICTILKSLPQPNKWKDIVPLPILSTIPITTSNPRKSKPRLKGTASSSSFPLFCAHFHKHRNISNKSTLSIKGKSLLSHVPTCQPNRPHWRDSLPTATALHWGNFNKLDWNHSFTQEASLNMIAFFFCRIPWGAIYLYNNCNFQWIKETNPNWAEQTNIHPDKPQAVLVCLFHYNMDTSLVMWYLGGLYCGALQCGGCHLTNLT